MDVNPVTQTDAETNAESGPRSVTILGSTGSVGCNTLELIEKTPGITPSRH